MIDKSLLDLLACPRCASRPPLAETDGALVCTECGYAYPIVDGIPHLLIEEAISPDNRKEQSLEQHNS